MLRISVNKEFIKIIIAKLYNKIIEMCLSS